MMSNLDESYVVAFNAGSSSLKFELFAVRSAWHSCLRGAVRDIGRARPLLALEGLSSKNIAGVATHAEAAELALDEVLDRLGGTQVAVDRIVATGHRVVHGGSEFVAPVRVTAAVMKRLRALAELAPLHNPPSLSVLKVVHKRLPRAPAVAVFDTAFFREMPECARRYAVPASWYAEHGVQRFGFHGIAHAYMSSRLQVLRGDGAPARRAVTLHLGHGCSAAALDAGRPVETSMGFTPLEGLIMSTRPGDVDAGAVLHMARQGRSWEALAGELNRESGLLGLSGASGDVRELLALDDELHAGARLALTAFCHRIRKYIGAYAAVLGGLDALAFGGGIGENAPRIRARICAGLEWLGIELDAEANDRCTDADGRISRAGSAVDVYVIPVREEEAIARAALACVETNDLGADT